MTRVFTAMVVASLLAVPPRASTARVAPSTAELAAELKPAVVHLLVYDRGSEPIGNGTGFFITDSGMVLTNAHVVQPARAMRARLLDGRELEVLGVVARDDSRDVAIVQVEGAGYPALSLDADASTQVGDKVLVIGSPMGLSWTVSEGIVSALREEGLPGFYQPGQDARGALLQITAPMSPGSSGSPVVTAHGRVVGVAVSIIRGGRGLNFAVPISAAVALTSTIAPDAQPQPFRRLPIGNLLISLAFFASIGLGWWLARGLMKRRQRPTVHLN